MAAPSTRAPSLPPNLARAAARRLGRSQALVVTRRQLYAAGVPRWLVRREVRVGRWQRPGRQTVVLHNGPLSDSARRWVAVLEGGPRAALAGVTALQEAGITTLGDRTVHVIVARGSRRIRLKGVRYHESRRWREADVIRVGIPRVAAPAAAVHAALWARTDREADDYEVTIEIDGPQHDEPAARLDDLVRDIGLATDGRTVVRIPMVAWRLGEGRVLDALEALFSARGWQRPAA